MPSTPKDMLPTPSLVEVVDETVSLVSSIGRLPFHHEPDPALHPRRLRVSWQNVTGAVGDAIRRRYDDFPYDVFAFKMPRTAEIVFATWASPPSIQWLTATTVTGISAEIEEALAHE